ncbi:cytochrome c oxidase subunit 3 [Flexibacterium corallicola]|uniref:cytochrome c oxidase subunit 3 n=1 Tax=Flexibacterium corallicola TaxID=3037259 RepID=UPI00286F90E8|nr:cytochrome c oxidase subunit 3 [Pseudovibrio sp. M1P-2-3]
MSAKLETPIEEFEHHQLSNRELGFWVFLMTDAIIFSLLFATYVVMLVGTAGGPTHKDIFEFGIAFWETMFLLTSTMTFGFAYICATRNDIGKAGVWLIATFILGGGFLTLELVEFASLVAAGAGPTRSGYMSSFFTLVGTHGLHVTFGMVGVLFLIFQMLFKGLTPLVRSRLFRLGLFWHFLDIVWIGIFSIVYLPGLI